MAKDIPAETMKDIPAEIMRDIPAETMRDIPAGIMKDIAAANPAGTGSQEKMWGRHVVPITAGLSMTAHSSTPPMTEESRWNLCAVPA